MHHYLVDAIPISHGSAFHDVVRMNSARDVRAKMARDGYVIRRLTLVEPEDRRAPHRYARVKMELFRQLALYKSKGATGTDIRAGLIPMFSRYPTPLVDLLQALLQRLLGRRRKSLGQTLADVIDHIASEGNVGPALSIAPHIFSPDEISLITLTEQRGHGVGTLEVLAEQFEREHEAQTKISSALWYPCVLLVAAIVLLAIFIGMMLPQLRTMYASLKIDLIFPLNVLAAFADLLAAPHFVLVIVGGTVGLLSLLVGAIRSSTELRYRFDLALLNLPLFGELLRLKRMTRALFAMQLMIKLGEKKNALNAAYTTAMGPVYRTALKAAQDRFNNGTKKWLSEALAPETEIFDALLLGIIRSAEAFGETEAFTGAITATNQRTDHVLRGLPKRLETAVGVFAALIVGALIYAIMVPTAYATAHFH